MPCFYCMNVNAWICDPLAPGPGVCDDAVGAAANWVDKGVHAVPGGTNNVWCRPGCDAKIQQDAPGNTPPWKNAGSIFFVEGNYHIWCKSGGSETCEVKIEKV